MIYSQQIDYKLKGLSGIRVVVQDDQNVLSPTLYQKLLTETKLKLMSAGLKVVNDYDDAPKLILKCNYIQSALSEHRILVQLRLVEYVTVNRLEKLLAEAITYQEMEFYTSVDIANSFYNKVMDKLLISFIEKFLNEKGN